MKKRIIIFYLIIIPILSNAQMLADFESAEKTPSVSAEGSASVVDNPDKSGINTSNNVGYYDKLEGNWHYVSLEFDSPVEIGYNNTLKFKVRASEKGRVFAKFWNGENVLIEHWAPVWEFMPESGEWTECYMDLTPAMQKSFTKLQLAMCVDNEARADVYFDDVELTNPELASGYPKVIFTTSDTNINVGESIEFNASGSFDYDGEIASFLWDFNDGETADGAEVAHTFTHAGSYWVKVSVTDNDGKVSSDSTVVFVFGDGEIASDVLFTHANIGVNEKAEAIFQINKAYTNVFDPDEVKVDAHVKLPDNTMLTIPCFYYVRSYVSNTEWLIDNSFQGWMLRFSSHVSGEAEIQIEINDSEGSWSSSKQNVIIESGEEKGIIHVDSDNKQYYRHKTGETFNPMGINIGWNNIKDYTEIITNLSDYNANTFRYWHTPFAKQALEWKNDGFYQGLGIYNQQAAAMTDSLVNLGEDLEMFMQLVIFQHGMFSENVNEMWEDNPYNTKNGGYVTKAEEYFYNEQCKDQTKKLLRYIIARWGYAKNIFAWEFFNEVQFTGVYESQSNQWYPGVQQWHSEMCRYVESIDPFNHIMTTSAADGMLADFDTIKALDNIQYHLYHNQVLDEQIKLDYQFKNELGKSVVNGEYGLKTDAEMTFDGQRHAVWHGIFTEVPHFMWVWGHYLDTTWAKLFEMPAKYLEGEDLAVKNGLQSFSFDVDSEIEFESIGIRNNQFFGGYLYTSNTQQLLDDVVVKLQEIPYGYRSKQNQRYKQDN